MRSAYGRRVAGRSGQGDEQVHLVTSAKPAHSEEMSGRTRKYLLSMGIRTVCLVLAIFVLHGWLRLIGIAAAIALPWFAVVIANAGPVPGDEEPEFVEPGRPEIEARADRQLESRADDPRNRDSA